MNVIFSTPKISIDCNGKKHFTFPKGYKQISETTICEGDTAFFAFTGKKGNRTVVDFDSEESFKKLENILNWNDTLTVKTRRGYHVHYQYDSEVGKGNKILDSTGIPDVDVKNDGDHITWKNTKLYSYEDPNKVIFTYKRISKTNDLIPMPEDLKKLIISAQVTKNRIIGNKKRARETVEPTDEVSCRDLESLDTDAIGVILEEELYNLGIDCKFNICKKNLWTFLNEGERYCPFIDRTHTNNNCFVKRDGKNYIYCCHSEQCLGEEKVILIDKIIYDYLPFANRQFYRMITKEDFAKFVKIEGIANIEKYLDQYLRFDVSSGNFIIKIRDTDGIGYVGRSTSETKNTLGICATIKNEDEESRIRLNNYLDRVSRVEYTYECPKFDVEGDKLKQRFNTASPMRLFYKWDEYADNEINDDTIRVWLNFVKEQIANGDETMYEYLLNWFAHMIQKPEEKPRTALVMIGEQGNGKGTLMRSLFTILGKHLSMQTSDMDDICGHFNDEMAGKILTVVDDAGHDKNYKENEQMKGLITEPTTRLNQKYKAKTSIQSYHRVVICSNKMNIVPIEATCRRYVVMKISDNKRDTEYWRVMNKMVALDDDYMTWVAKWLSERDISKWTPENYPKTELRAEMQINKLHNFIHAVNAWFQENSGKKPFKITASDLMQEIQWKSKEYEITHMKPKHHKVWWKQYFGLESKKSDGVMKYRIDMSEIEKKLNEQGLIDDEEMIDHDDEEDEGFAPQRREQKEQIRPADYFKD